MSEESILPPELPGTPKSSAKFTSALAWLVIIASVSFLAWTANLDPESDAETLAADGANELALLKIQSRLVIGLTQFSPRESERAVEQLETLATTAKGKAAVAAVYAFVDKKDGVENGNKILDTIKDDAELLNLVRQGLENGVDETGRESLVKEIGWFAELIRPEGEVPSGFGKEIRRDATKSAVIFGLFFLVIFIAFVAGLVLFVLFIVSKSNGSLTFRYQPKQNPELKHLFVEAFAIYIGIMALGHLLATAIDPRISMVCYALSFILALFWPKIRGCSWKQSRELIGWNRGAGFFKEVGAGIVGYLGVLIIAGIGLTITLILAFVINLVLHGGAPPETAGASHPIVGMLDSAKTLGGKLSLLFLAAGLAPFLEETMFRGSLFRYFRHNWGFFLSSIVGGIIFAVIHPQGWMAVPALCAMGVGFSLLREWRDSLVASMTAHAINNGMIVSFILAIIG